MVRGRWSAWRASSLAQHLRTQRRKPLVASWFNRGCRDVTGAIDGVSTDTGAGAYTEKTVFKAEFVALADEVIDAKITGTVTKLYKCGRVRFRDLL